MLHLLSDVLKETGMITAFVLIIMLFIEVLNIATQGSWAKCWHVLRSGKSLLQPCLALCRAVLADLLRFPCTRMASFILVL